MNEFKLNNKNCKFLITGGTGFIGSALIKQIKNQAKSITVLTRKKLKNYDNITYINNLNQKEFNYDVVINLAGEPIATFWSKKNKDKILSSRVNTTKEIVDLIISSVKKPAIFISGSAIGYYGISQDKIFNENDFLAQNLFSQQLCIDWEKEANRAKDYTKLAIIRTGVVLQKDAGFLKKMLPIFKFGLGGKVASGRQFLSWIHLNDQIRAILFVINNNLQGEFNLTAPQAVTNCDFAKIFAKVLNRPCFFDTPEFVLRFVYGKMADELLIGGQNVFPKKLIDNGFVFEFADLKKALEFEFK